MIFCKALWRAGRKALDAHHAPEVQGSAVHRVADVLRHRMGFAGQRGLVAGGVAGDDLGIHGN